MRSVVLGVCLLVSCSVPTADAQERQLGVKVGPTFASPAIEPSDVDPGFGRRIAAGGGGFIVLPLTGRVSVQLEALYTRKGGKLDLSEGGANATGTLLLDYAEFPVLARVTAIRMPSYSIHVFGGPSAGVRVRAAQQVAVSGGGFRNGVIEDIDAEVRLFEGCFVAGAGVDVGRRLVIDGRYTWGLTDINGDAPAGEIPRLPADASVRNRASSVMAGFRF